MNKKNLNGFFFPAVAGLFFFLKRPKSEDIYQVEPNYPVYTRDPSGATGVAKYLEKQNALVLAIETQDELSQPLSGVAKYIAKQAAIKSLHVKKAEVEVSGVAKYLQRLDSLPQPSKVAKYLAKQAAISALAPKEVIKPVATLTGVAKYLDNQASQPQASRVAKYLARQALSERQKPTPKVTGVEKYLSHQA